MAQIAVTIAGRVYRMSCGPGEEAHLEGLAALLDTRINEMRGSFGEIGDQRLIVMAAITIADDLAEARSKAHDYEAQIEKLQAEQASAEAASSFVADDVARALDAAAKRIERLAQDMNAAGSKG